MLQNKQEDNSRLTERSPTANSSACTAQHERFVERTAVFPLWVFLYDFRDVEGSLSGCFYVLSLCLGSKQAIFLGTGHTAPNPCFKPLNRKLIFWPRPKLRWVIHGSQRFKA
jgi:hypothetical protein